MIVVLEGLDGCGKTSVGRAVAEKLGCELLHFPDDRAVSGASVRSFLRGEWGLTGNFSKISEALVFQALQVVNRLEHWDKLMQASGSKDHHLVLSRYWQSGVVYGGLDGLDTDWLMKIFRIMPSADLSVLLRVSPKVAADRRFGRDGTKSPERYEKSISTYQKVHARFRELWNREFSSGGLWIGVPADVLSVDELAQVILHRFGCIIRK